MFVDESAPAGVPHYYRVVAKNSSGRSDYSQPVGPITAKRGLVADELLDASSTVSVAGDHAFVSNKARGV